MLCEHRGMTGIGRHDRGADLDSGNAVAALAVTDQSVETEDVGHPRGGEPVVGRLLQLVAKQAQRLRPPGLSKVTFRFAYEFSVPVCLSDLAGWRSQPQLPGRTNRADEGRGPRGGNHIMTAMPGYWITVG